MPRMLVVLLALTLFAACARRDPVLDAAEDFRDAAYEAVERDENRSARLHALSLGMTDREILEAAGPPSSRSAGPARDGHTREVWIYRGSLGRHLGTLVLEDRKLVRIDSQ